MEDSSFVLQWLGGVIREVGWDLNGLSTGSVESWLKVRTKLTMSRSLWLGATLAFMLLVLWERSKDLWNISVVTVNLCDMGFLSSNKFDTTVFHAMSYRCLLVPGTLRVFGSDWSNPTKKGSLLQFDWLTKSQTWVPWWICNFCFVESYKVPYIVDALGSCLREVPLIVCTWYVGFDRKNIPNEPARSDLSSTPQHLFLDTQSDSFP